MIHYPFILCLAASSTQANQIVDHLKLENFSKNHISTLLVDQSQNYERGGAENLKTSESELEGPWRYIAGTGERIKSGAGFFIAAGPIIPIMNHAKIGMAFGGVCSGLIRMGIPLIEAKNYEEKILKGNILLSVEIRKSAEIYRAKNIFKDAEAFNIFAMGA